MGKIERLEQQIRELSAQELAELRRWFVEYDADAWDRQIEADAKAGKLDHLMEEALAEYKAGKTRPL
jgi:hypothetical protein